MVKTPLFVAAICLVLTLPPFVLAAEPGGHGHEPLGKSETLTFDAIFRQALEHSPESLGTEAQRQQAESHQALGRSWTAGRPSFELNYIDDTAIDKSGLREMEAGIQVPLWRPGERRDARQSGQAYGAAADAWEKYLKLTVAGRLRASLMAIDKAETVLRLERQATREAGQLLETTRSLFDAGSLPRLDVLQAENLLLNQRQVEMRAEAGLVDAEREYSVLTGLKVRPVRPYEERRFPGEEVPPTHPALEYLRSQVAVAEAAVQRSIREAKGSPTLTVGMRRERSSAAGPEVDSVGLGLSIPFGGGAFVSTAASDARRQQVDAEVRWRQARRELNRQLHEVEHELLLTADSLKLSAEQVNLGRQRYEMARTAFEAGESTLTEVLRALREYRNSEKELQTLQVRQRALITEYNQTIGVLP